MQRLKAFVMWILYFVCSTRMYLRLNGYNSEDIGARMEKVAKKALARVAKEHDW